MTSQSLLTGEQVNQKETKLLNIQQWGIQRPFPFGSKSPGNQPLSVGRNSSVGTL